ncbi:MAG: efflux RND transporter periplasmic adaptor subunit [Bacteroidota bacterium]
MKKIVITAILSIAVGLIGGWLAFRPAATPSGERKILYYRDPMNPESTSPTPKKAPDGMDFVPVYADQGTATQGGKKKILYYKDPMHPWYTSDKPGKAPDCGMDLVPVYEGESDANAIKIDPTVVQNIGVKVEDVKMRKLHRIIRTVGKVQYDETKVYSINTKIMGWVDKLRVDYTGQLVRKGEPLLDLYSPELVSTQEEYLQALRYEKRMSGSPIGEARSGAEELAQSAKRRLLNWDIPEREIAALQQRGTPQKAMTFYSPFDGYVIEKMVYEGQNVMAGMELYKVADLSTVWIIAEIYQYELPWIKVGQKAGITLSYLPGKKFEGTVTYIYPTLSMETKTVKVRIAVRNTPGLEFKPEMFATVEIASPVSVTTVAVPEQAIIRSGERDVAVIALGGGYFDARDVTLGVSADGYVQILKGVKAGEKIVVSSQFLIDSESNLRAAISQMSGHAGMDMSKPMDSTTQQPEGSKGKDMENMPGMEQDSGKKSGSMERSSIPGTKPTVSDKVTDPVCGMKITADESRSLTYGGRTYSFCSKDDMAKFKSDPEKYVRNEQ